MFYYFIKNLKLFFNKINLKSLIKYVKIVLFILEWKNIIKCFATFQL